MARLRASAAGPAAIRSGGVVPPGCFDGCERGKLASNLAHYFAAVDNAAFTDDVMKRERGDVAAPQSG